MKICMTLTANLDVVDKINACTAWNKHAVGVFSTHPNARTMHGTHSAKRRCEHVE